MRNVCGLLARRGRESDLVWRIWGRLVGFSASQVGGARTGLRRRIIRITQELFPFSKCEDGSVRLSILRLHHHGMLVQI
jgi:hypothetical protein